MEIGDYVNSILDKIRILILLCTPLYNKSFFLIDELLQYLKYYLHSHWCLSFRVCSWSCFPVFSHFILSKRNRLVNRYSWLLSIIIFCWLRIDTKDKKCSLPQKMTLDQKKAPSPYSAFYASKNRRIQQNQLSLFTALFLLLKLHQHSPVYNLILFHCPRGARQCLSSGHFLVYL